MPPKTLPHRAMPPGMEALYSSTVPEEKEAKIEQPPKKVIQTPPTRLADNVVNPPPTYAKPTVAPVARASEASATTKRKRRNRHTLVIPDEILDDLEILAWDDDLSVSAVAREAFKKYFAVKRADLEAARRRREQFAREKSEKRGA